MNVIATPELQSRAENWVEWNRNWPIRSPREQSSSKPSSLRISTSDGYARLSRSGTPVLAKSKILTS